MKKSKRKVRIEGEMKEICKKFKTIHSIKMMDATHYSRTLPSQKLNGNLDLKIYSDHACNRSINPAMWSIDNTLLFSLSFKYECSRNRLQLFYELIFIISG